MKKTVEGAGVGSVSGGLAISEEDVGGGSAQESRVRRGLGAHLGREGAAMGRVLVV